MSITSFFKSAEEGAVKVATFIMKEMANVETVLGGGTGNAKANIAITAVEGMLAAMGVPVGTVQTEVKAVNDAMAALMKKLGLLTSPTPPTTPAV